ncbi:MAG: TolB family protein, partial [Opitutales bacterium]
MSPLNFELAAGWRLVEPRADAPELLVEAGGCLLHWKSDFTQLHAFGEVGPVDCPAAYDPLSRTAYRYVCESRLQRRDFSRLLAYDLDGGGVRTVLDLPLNQWVLWLLEWVEGRGPEEGRLFGLVAADRPADDRVVIEHRLFTMAPSEPRPRLRPLCRDAYRPLAFSRRRRELVFAGAEGVYILGLKGERLAALPLSEGPGGDGASFDPSGGPRVALGGEGIHLWDFGGGRCERLVRLGRHPVWSPDGRGIYYAESSGDLHYYDLDAGRSVRLVGLRDNRLPEFWHARPVCMDGSGRFLALPLTGKRLKGVARASDPSGVRERVYEHRHTLCVLDTERRELWHRDGAFVNRARWT